MAAMYCTVAIPTRGLFSGMIHYANVPGEDGFYGVLPGHEMLVATNKRGGVLTLNLDEAGQEKKQFLLYEGATQVYNNTLTVLGRFGVAVEDIDPEAIRAKKEKLEAKVAEYKESDDEQDQAAYHTSQHRLAWYQLQIDYAESSTK